MTRRGLALAMLVTALAAAPAHAEGYLTPFVGGVFGGDTDDTKLTFGGSVLFKSADGPLGFAIEFSRTPDFFGSSIGDNSITTLMGNLVFMSSSSGAARIYGSGGLGLSQARAEDIDRFFEIDSNEFAFNVGAGVLLLFSDSVGLQGDLRYFRNLTDPEPDDEFDLDFGDLNYWRATAGLVFKF
jgi:opacity protein-like surface antigen